MWQKGRSHRRRHQGRGKEGGGCIVVVKPQRHNVEKRLWRGDNDDSCGRRDCVVIVIVIVERCGQRPGGEGGRRTATTMAGGVVASSSSTSCLRWHWREPDLSCKVPPSSRWRQRRSRRAARWRDPTINIASTKNKLRANLPFPT